MDYVAILAFIEKAAAYAKVAIDLGKSAAFYIDAINTATKRETTPEKMAELDAQIREQHRRTQALPDDPADAAEVLADQERAAMADGDAGGDGGKPQPS